MTSLKPVSDPALLQQLNGAPQSAGPKIKPVTDPATLAKLNAPQAPLAVRTDETGQTHSRGLPMADVTKGFDALREAQVFKPDGILGKIYNAPLDLAEAGAKGMATVGNQVLKGSRDLVAGVASYPFDLANELGLKNEIGTDIRHALPQIDTSNVGEDIGAAVGQFGVPAGAAVKGVQALAKAGEVGPIATRLAQWLAAAYSDLVATDPDQAATIGNLTGGPTKIENTDTDMSKRTKVGGEALILGPTVDAVATGARKAVDFVEPIVKNMKSGGRELTVGKQLKEAGVTPQAAEDAVDLRQGGYQPLTSDIVNTPEAQNLARGAVNSPAGAKVVQRMKENEQSIAQGFDRELAGDNTAQNGASTEFSRQGQAVTDQGTQRVAGLTGQRTTAQSALQQEQAALRNRTGTRQDASANLADLLEQEKASATRVKGGLYDQAKALGRSVQVDPTPMSALARQIDADISSLAQPHPDLANILSDVQRLSPRPGQVVETGLLGTDGRPLTRPAAAEPITMADLIDFRKRLNKAINTANGPAQMRGDAIERMQQLKSDIDRRIESLAQDGSPAAAALQQAETNFRENFAPRYRQGVGGKLDKAERANNPVQPTAVAERFLKPSGGTAGGAREAVEDLNRIFEGTPNQTVARAQGRNYMIGLLADQTAADGAVDAARVERFLQKYGEAIDGLGMRPEVQQMVNRLRSGEQTVGRLEQEIAAAEQAAGEGASSFRKSPAGLWIDNPEKAVNAALDDPRAMDALIAAAKQDASGAALKDIQNQVGNAVNARIRNPGSQTIGGNAATAVKQGDLSVSLAKANDLLAAGSKSRAALERLYGPAKMKALDLYRKQLELSSRMTQMRGSKGSDTTVNVLSAMQSGLAVSQGQIMSAWPIRLIKFLDQVTLKTGAKLADLQARALTDPDLAVTLMMKYTDSTAPVVERRLQTYLENNLLGQWATGDSPQR